MLDEARAQVEIKSQWQPLVEGLYLRLGWEGSPLPSAWHYQLEEALRQRVEGRIPLPLAELTPWSAKGWDSWNRRIRSMGAVTLVEHAVATHGRERLPALLHGLAEHETWDALIPAVFGVPMRDFEAGWQAYLAARYAVLTETGLGSEQANE